MIFVHQAFISLFCMGVDGTGRGLTFVRAGLCYALIRQSASKGRDLAVLLCRKQNEYKIRGQDRNLNQGINKQYDIKLFID